MSASHRIPQTSPAPAPVPWCAECGAPLLDLEEAAEAFPEWATALWTCERCMLRRPRGRRLPLPPRHGAMRHTGRTLLWCVK